MLELFFSSVTLPDDQYRIELNATRVNDQRRARRSTAAGDRQGLESIGLRGGHRWPDVFARDSD